MAHLPPSAHHLFRSQHGVAGLEQLIATGLSRRQVKRLAADGDILPGLRGTYRSPSVTEGELMRCAEVCLARSNVAIAGPTAGRIWQLRHLAGDRRVHVIAPRASNPAIAPWVRTYHTNAIHDDDVIQRGDGIRITTPARTVFDLARFLEPRRLLSTIEQVMQRHGVTESELRRVASDWLSPQRPWALTFLHQLGRRLPGGAAESHPEVRVANALRALGVRGLERQHRIELPRYGMARFDLAIPRLRWAVEIDVYPSHDETNGRASDERRDEAANSLGWLVTRISAADYTGRFDARMSEVGRIYHDRTRSAMSQRTA